MNNPAWQYANIPQVIDGEHLTNDDKRAWYGSWLESINEGCTERDATMTANCAVQDGRSL